MGTTLKQVESAPASYPATPAGLSGPAAALDPVMIWQRIESYIAYRWTARAVVWTVEGGGLWEPPLTPATLTATDVWQGDSWVGIALAPSPYGGLSLPSAGPYRITATVGAGTVPAAVNEAFRRLAEYMAGGNDHLDKAGATSYSLNLGGDMEQSVTRNQAWMARAMQNSGAGDLLRPYRRV